MTVADIVRTDLVRTHAVPAASAAGRRVRAGGARRDETFRGRFRAWLVVSDVALAVSAALAMTLAAGQSSTSGISPWVWLAALPVVWAFLTLVVGGYEGGRHDAGVFDLRRVLLTGTILLAAIPLAGLAGLDAAVPATAPAAIVGLATAAVGTRVLERRRVRRGHERGVGMERVAVAGDAAAAARLVALLDRDLSIGLRPVIVCVPEGTPVGDIEHWGLADVMAPIDSINSIDSIDPVDSIHSVDSADTAPVLAGLGDPDLVVRRALAAGATALTLTGGPTTDAATLRAIARSAEWVGLTVMFAPNVIDVTSTSPVVPVAGSPILRLQAPGPCGAPRFAKCLIDRIGAAIGLLLGAPVLLVIAALVRVDSRGPALFRQRRVGAGGREFTMLKFRSMRAGAEADRAALEAANESTGPIFKIRDDPRVTRVGRWLRRTSLDELPQLINVLRGDMSLVGPRPPLPDEVARYTAAERRRLLVAPGLTGLWQVSGRSDLEWADAVRLDLSYVSNWSVSMDLRLLARTAAAVVRRDGAY